MHIPTDDSHFIEIKTFDEDYKESLTADGFDSKKWIYVPGEYRDYRYLLGTRGKNPVICIGINPSTAEPENLDNTLKSVERLAHFNGYDSFVMFNVYAQRATRPKDMDAEVNTFLHNENMKAFDYVLSHSQNATVWAAWGSIVNERNYLKSCVKEMIEIGEKYNAKWVHAGKLLKNGHPHHPLYLCKTTPFEDYDIKDYVDTL